MHQQSELVLEKSISSSPRYYLDYNATAPVSESVLNWLKTGAVDFKNPSSIHQSGKQSKKIVREANHYFYETFKLSETEFQLFYHSGATEGLNQVLKGFALCNPKSNFVFFATDHSAVVKQIGTLEKLGTSCKEVAVDKNGQFDKAWLENELATLTKKAPTLLNLTWVNNETGQLMDLAYFHKLKTQFSNLFIHVDAVQAPLKIEDWPQLDSVFDVFTFSGHKFGGLKGIGMTFVRDKFPMQTLIEGGGQQAGLRSGTENIIGIHSMALALQDARRFSKFTEDRNNRNWFEQQLKKDFDHHVIIVGENFDRRNTSTCNFIFTLQKSDITTMALDLEGLEVSSGSACSSGATIPSRVLMSMGHTKEQALQAIRVSFGPGLEQVIVAEIYERFKKVLSRYL